MTVQECQHGSRAPVEPGTRAVFGSGVAGDAQLLQRVAEELQPLVAQLARRRHRAHQRHRQYRTGAIGARGVALDSILEEIERGYLKKALDCSNGNKNKAAELLGISFRSLRYRLAKQQLNE